MTPVGGNRTFAAGANWIGQLEGSERSERRSNFSDVQAQRVAATSPVFQMRSRSILRVQKIKPVASGP
jgi:hypothetical protein